MTESTERAAFEAWMRQTNGPLRDFDLKWYESDGSYDNTGVNAAWNGWQARAILAEGKAEPAWLPIETAPKDGSLIVLGARNGVWLGKYQAVYQSGYRPDNPWSSMLLNHDHMAERYTRPTHWMPLPSPPSMDGAVQAATSGGER